MGVGILKVLNPLHIVNITAVTLVLGLYFAKLMEKKIGGITGDTLGAVLELSEILVLLGFYISLASALGKQFSI